MARGSIGRERMISGVGGISSSHQQQPGGHQEELNNELLQVSRQLFIEYSVYVQDNQKFHTFPAIKFYNWQRNCYLNGFIVTP